VHDSVTEVDLAVGKLEEERIWTDIVPLLATEPIPEVAARFGLSAGAIASAMVRTGFVRRAVTPSPETLSDLAASPEIVTQAPLTLPPEPEAPRRGRPARSRLDGLRHLVGVRSDAFVGEVAGLSREAVRQYRVKHGIPAAEAAEPAPPGEIDPPERDPAVPTAPLRKGGPTSAIDPYFALLGKVPDRELAQSAGVSVSAVSQYRRFRNIPAFKREDAVSAAPSSAPVPREPPPGAAAAPSARRSSPLDLHRDLLGSMSDRDLAEHLGMTVESVSSYRRRQGILPFGSSQPAHSVPPPAHAAEVLPVDTAAAPRRRSSIDAYAHLLGVRSDADVARLAGVTASGVFQYRATRGIPGYKRGSVETEQRVPTASAPDAQPAHALAFAKPSPLRDHEELLGTLPDSEVARRLGMSAMAVSSYRRRKRIPAFGQATAPAPGGAAAPAPVQAAGPVPAAVAEPAVARARGASARSVAHAYVAVVRRGDSQQSYALIGPVIADASARASRAAGDGEVISLVRHLEALVD
jgi:transcriptional regulator with XRE-family HTH domain